MTLCFLVINVSWGGDTWVEGVEHVEGSAEWIGVTVEIYVTIWQFPAEKKAAR